MGVGGGGVEVIPGLAMVEVGMPGGGELEGVEVGKPSPVAVGEGICVGGGVEDAGGTVVGFTVGDGVEPAPGVFVG